MSAFLERKESNLYRDYISECLRLISENIAKPVCGEYVSKKYRDISKSSVEKLKETKYTPGKISERIKSKFM